MDATEAIVHCARTEAKGFRVGLTSDDVDGTLPYFHIERPANKRYRVTGYNHAGHDNEPRMSYVCDFLRDAVLPYVDSSIDVSGYYNIELHDSYTYLDTRARYGNCLTFSRRREDTSMALLPNPYQMSNYSGGKLNDLAADAVPWDKKSDSLFFVGSSTGARQPLLNERVAACVWSLQHRDKAHFRISSVVQMSHDSFYASVPEAKEIVCPAIPQADNYKHKYLVNMAGNTCAWSRLPMILASKSLLLNLRPRNGDDDMEWFYPMLTEGTHYLGCTLATILDKRAFAMSNPQLVQYMIANANRFCAAFLGRVQATLYTAALLEAMNRDSKP